MQKAITFFSRLSFTLIVISLLLFGLGYILPSGEGSIIVSIIFVYGSVGIPLLGISLLVLLILLLMNKSK